MEKIKLTQGKFAIIDDSDLKSVNQYKWFYGGSGYAVKNVWDKDRKKQTTLRLHRFIVGLDFGDDREVDHINRNRLDCRRSNLRICIREQNVLNHPIRKDNSSGFKGVSFYKKLGKWGVNISFSRKRYFLGVFSDKVEAAKKYNTKAVEFFGEFAQLNTIK